MGRVTTRGLLQANKMQADTIDNLRAQLQQAQEDVECEQDAHKAHLNSLERVKAEWGAAIKRLSDYEDAPSVLLLLADRDAAIKRGVQALHQLGLVWDVLRQQLLLNNADLRFGISALDEIIERVKAAETREAELREAGVTDYSRPPWGLNRVDCHFCNGVWQADEPAKHKKGCPLLTPAEALRAVRAKHRTPPSGEHRSPQSGQARQEESDEVD